MSISKIDELISEGDSFLASSNSMKFRQAAPNFSVDCEVYAPGQDTMLDSPFVNSIKLKTERQIGQGG